MDTRVKNITFLIAGFFLLSGTQAAVGPPVPAQDTPKVVIETIVGDITIELFGDLAPITVDNFLQYVNDGFYDGLIIHRVINAETFALVQGGGYRPGGYLKTNGLRDPIINESYNNLSNLRGTIAMARLPEDPNSAKSQFYINTIDNTYLDKDQNPDGYGHCVFGQVVSGMDVVDQIVQLPLLPPYLTNGLPNCPFYNNTWVYTWKAQTRAYVAPDGSDTTGIGSPNEPFQTIQKGIDMIDEPGHVVVAPGTYTGPGNIDLNYNGKAITIRTIQPSDAETVIKTVIDCQADSANKHRAFIFENNEEPNSVLKGFTMLNGYHTNGGAIFCHASPTIKNCLIINSTAENYGGGIYFYNSAPQVINCTLAGNTALLKGGGISCDHAGGLTLTNSILWNNTAPTGPQVALLTGVDASALTVWYSDIQDELGQIHTEGNWSVNWELGNIDIDPCFVHPQDDDYHLQSTRWQWEDANGWVQGQHTSRCIDAGNPGCPPVREFGTTSVRINMGAFGGTTKASIPPADWALRGDLNNDGFTDGQDFAVFASYWSDAGNELPADLNRNKGVGPADLSLFLDDWLIGATWFWAECADLNNDNIVNFEDYARLTQNWLTTGTDITGDITGNDLVNFDDLNAMLYVWLHKTD